jgi:hypothetical protein
LKITYILADYYGLQEMFWSSGTNKGALSEVNYTRGVASTLYLTSQSQIGWETKISRTTIGPRDAARTDGLMMF